MNLQRILGTALAMAAAAPILTAQDGALRFDGATGYGRAVGGAPVRNSTWEFWFKQDSLSGNDSIGWPVGWWGSWTGAPVTIRHHGGVSGPSGWGPHDGSDFDLLPEGSLEAGRWYHFAAVLTGDCAPGVTVYLDGQPIGQYGPGGQCPSSGIATTLAAYNYLGWKGFLRGTIDEVRISTVPRYNGPFVPPVRFEPDPDTWGLWHFDEGEGSVAHDEVAGRNFSLNGGFFWEEGLGGNCTAEPFCTAAPNSAGAGASISMTGSTSVSANDLTLVTSGAPAGTSGLFVYAAVPAEEPFGDGVRCVGTNPLGVFRLSPTLFTDEAGSASRLVDLESGAPAAGNGAIAPGSTWFFQFWYRDLAAGASGFNATDGLSVTFCP